MLIEHRVELMLGDRFGERANAVYPTLDRSELGKNPVLCLAPGQLTRIPGRAAFLEDLSIERVSNILPEFLDLSRQLGIERLIDAPYVTLGRLNRLGRWSGPAGALPARLRSSDTPGGSAQAGRLGMLLGLP